MATHMSDTKLLKGECQHCGGHLEFPAEAVGASAECPHCHQTTELVFSLGETDDPARPARTKTIIFISLACLILLGGLAGALIALKRAKRITEGRPSSHPAAVTNAVVNPFSDQQFSASAVTLQKASGSSLIHAVGSVKNLSAQRRFAVHVEIELKDDSGQLLAPAKDYTATMEPDAVWSFKALVNAKGATTARVSAITEDK